jgi:hypothetical protein
MVKVGDIFQPASFVNANGEVEKAVAETAGLLKDPLKWRAMQAVAPVSDESLR